MGRGNYAPPKDGDVYYINYDYFEDEHGCLDEYLMDDFEYEITKRFIKKYPSFGSADHYIDRETHAVAENALYWLGFADNGWSLAVVLGPQDTNEGLIRAHKGYKTGLLSVLLDIFPEVGVYTGPWTHGTEKRN